MNEPSMISPPRNRMARVFVLLALFAVPSIAFAHAVVFPKTSTPGAYEKYVLRVPNERDVPTLRVELHFPAGLRVVSFADVPGWKLQVLTDSAQAITGAVWTGVLQKERFVEFPFVAVNPKDSTSLAWPTYQTYENGERVEWTSPDTAAKTPVSTTRIADVAVVPIKVSRTSLYISIVALAFALTALGVAIRPKGVDVKP
ncbi:MAG: YcnI family copper-binding membrane protein [Gemmatimonadaceae bacterium]